MGQVECLGLEKEGVLLSLSRLSTLELSLSREITKPLRPMGKATSLLLEILGLLCKSMVSGLFRE